MTATGAVGTAMAGLAASRAARRENVFIVKRTSSESRP